MKDHELLFNLENFQKHLDLLSCNMLSQETKAKYYEAYRKFLEAEKKARYGDARFLHRIVSVISKDNGLNVISYNAAEQKQAKAKICEMFYSSAFDRSKVELSTSISKNAKLLPLEQSKILRVSETEIYCRHDVHRLPNLYVDIIKAQISDEFNAFELLNDEISFFDSYKPLMNAHRLKVRLYKCTDFPGDVLLKEIEEQKKKDAELAKQKGLDIY